MTKSGLLMCVLLLGGAGSAFAAGGGPIVINVDGRGTAIPLAQITVDGKPYTAGTPIVDDVYPTQHCVRVTGEGIHVICWETVGSNYAAPPTMGGDHWIMGSPDPSVTVTHRVTVTDKAFYVDPVNGVDDTDHGTREQPFRTPIYAAEQAKGQNRAVIYCAAGTYSEGGFDDGNQLNRLHNYGCQMLFRGAGIGKSILRGKLDTESDVGLTEPIDGRGPKAIRTAYFTTGTADKNAISFIQGFTVTDGRCASKSNGNNVPDRGGAGYNASFADCFITNCAAYRGQSIYGGRLVRCRVVGCGSTRQSINGRLVEGSGKVFACLIGPQYLANTEPIQDSGVFYHCTIDAVHKDTKRVYGSGSAVYNSVTCPSATPTDAWNYTMKGTVTKWTGEPSAKLLEQDVLNADPQFIDRAAGDYHLASGSPAIGRGILPEDYWKWYSSDIEGLPVSFDNGRPTAGAFQKLTSGVYVSVSSPYAEVAPAGYHELAPGESLTVSVVNPKRPPLGFVVNGEFRAGCPLTLTAPEDGSALRASFTDVVFGTNWYVNVMAAVSDANDGFTPETPKRTLAGVFRCAVLPGDVVHVAEGDYFEGLMDGGNTSHYIMNRVAVPENVTLIADGSQAKTRILGAESTDSARDADGCGVGAVRCAYVAAGARLVGFTLAGGRTHKDITGSASTQDCYGGGVFAITPGVVENCCITNSSAPRGSAVMNGIYRGCRILDAKPSTPTSSGIWSTLQEISSSYIDYTRNVETCPQVFVNNFIGPHFYTGALRPSGGDNGRALYTTLSGQIVRNNIICGLVRNMGTSAFVLTNCVTMGFQSHGGGAVTPTYAGFGGTWSQEQIEAELTPDAQGFWTLKGKDSQFVDQDDEKSARAYVGEVDLFGNPRVLNIAVDIGPWEYDWRTDFTAALPAYNFRVTSASPDVTLTDGRVTLLDGASLVCAWGPIAPRGRRSVPVEIVGSGELEIRSNGALVATCQAGDTQAVFPPSGANEELRFSFIGKGQARLRAPSILSGSHVHFR